MNTHYLDTPIGALQLLVRDGALIRICFPEQFYEVSDEQQVSPYNSDVLQTASAQLQEYFAGQRQRFDLPLGAQGTAFQHSVWRALGEIPYGELRSYRDIACQIGRDKAVRAVGAANGRNPLPIVVPCHRVIGSDGSLTGFAGGLAIKRQLLMLEGSLPK